ncbi:DnaJ domain [Trypanosoma vivax]|uniref:Putative chaperone protein DNAj n=1 Tax=Trypanosoma vivax (strain Y486) TaxID=1055687 RepID=G0TZC8_TRYVY|nr:putative chaperone protein DNAj [Trypanosoma vivax]KAH8620551.1 DnaJ domain [Trypanosoma vivax]CCC49331.1 putative chaperone protein DNAj [Trypanosoma vivax Y486]
MRCGAGVRRGTRGSAALSHCVYFCHCQWFSRVPYGNTPSDFEASRFARKPHEEKVLRTTAKRVSEREATSPSLSSATSAEGYNPWLVLGLKPGVSTQTLRMRYHELMKEVHPDLEPNGVGDIPRMNQINKAYEIITKSPTLDHRYRNLISDTQYFYYRFLPEWMARNVDEMPRYWSWIRWRLPSGFQLLILCCSCYMVGRFYRAFPILTSVFLLSVSIDVLFHTMIAPATCSMLFLYSILSSQSYNMAWLTSPRSFLSRELGY